MSRADRDRWDAHYATADARSAPPRETLRWLPPAADRQHLVLDLACGTGRHTRALLDAGYRVVAADISRVALARLRASITARSCAALVQIDAEGWPFAEASFDIIVQIDFLDREALPSIRRTVKPGGLLLIDTFAGEPLPGGPGPQRSAWRLAPGEITARFADWEVLRVSDDRGQERSAVLARRPRG